MHLRSLFSILATHAHYQQVKVHKNQYSKRMSTLINVQRASLYLVGTSFAYLMLCLYIIYMHRVNYGYMLNFLFECFASIQITAENIVV